MSPKESAAAPVKSYVRNCLFIQRLIAVDSDGTHRMEQMFYQVDDTTILATLDGYAIIPREDYERLIGIQE